MRKRARGVSVVACTNDRKFLKNVFRNFRRQKWRKKEMIVIVNKNSIPLRPYKRKAKKMKNVRVYRRPGKVTLGRCLNYGVRKARYGVIAKFDHDDYYAKNYLRGSMRILRRKNVDIAGKRSVYLYLHSRKALYIWGPKNENKFDRLIAGGTIMFKKKIFKRVRFANKSVGEDIKFLSDARKKGLKIYSGNRFNYIYRRRKNPKSHTWKTGDRYLIRHSKMVRRIGRFKSVVKMTSH